MPPSRLRLLLAALVLGALGWLGARGAGSLPPLGGFLEPAHGVWALARTAPLPRQQADRIPGLTAPVEVVTDDRGVPHIFAATEEDAWRAQGWVVARDRLFQMELQARAAEGTLSELVGARALEADRTARRRGLPWAAARLARGIDSSALIARAARAYADGVNAWIASMDRGQLPLEYRLLGARPRRWAARNTFDFFNQMALTLAWQDETLTRIRVRALVGREAAEALFPVDNPIVEPIQPNGGGHPRFDFLARLPPPGAPDTVAIAAAGAREAVALALGLRPEPPDGGDAIGSNNWTVGPRRSRAGYALLAGDPHLELTVPSIWYEIHLNVTGGPDAAGVTFAGAPGVIIGFNRHVAWSFTNTGADVRDHYAEAVDDEQHPARYRLDGQWKPLEVRVDTVRGPGGRVLAVDTLRYTHRGPLVRTGGAWLSVRWTPFEARGGEEFLRLDRAGSVRDWLEAWKGFPAPAQNGVVAGREGSIAIRSTGWYPRRPGDGRGDEIRDGSTSASDWKGYLPAEAYPFALDPAQGFLASANQQPVDPRESKGYLGANWIAPWRALRINQLLRGDSSVTPDAMRAFQTDPGSARADAFVPRLLAAAAGRPAAAAAARLMGQWDRRYTRDNLRAVLFEAVMAELPRLTWDELTPPPTATDSTPAPAAVPSESVLLELMADSASAWWDDRRTAAVEHRDDILAAAMVRGLERSVREHGPPDGEGWRWSAVHHANIYHLLRVPALSALELPVQGGPSTLSPSAGSGVHGASWRMVVELGPEVRAWGTYPGGQSANPASAGYLDRLPRWLGGELDTLLFPKSPAELPPGRVRSRLLLTGSDR